jgi:hypothetical protein
MQGMNMKKGIIFKGIVNYIFAMIFAIIFGLFLDANVGWFILFTLILAPLLSVFLAWLAAHMIKVSCEMSDALLAKGDSCTMKVLINNKSIFPTPPLEVFLTNEAGVRADRRSLLVSLLPKGCKNFEVKFQAKISGKSQVGIDKVKVTDYLGLFSFAVKGQDYGFMRNTVAVIPNIAELSARDENLIKAMQSSHYMMLGRNLLYTAMTRAKKLLIIVGSRKALEMAVANYRAEVRFTRLPQRLAAQCADD